PSGSGQGPRHPNHRPDRPTLRPRRDTPGRRERQTPGPGPHAEQEPATSKYWFASDFAAEIGVRNYPRLAVFSGDLRGAVHARSQWTSPSVEAVRGDQVGDLLAGDRGRDQPGRGRPQVAHRRIDGDRDTAHGQGRRLGRAGTQTRTT